MAQYYTKISHSLKVLFFSSVERLLRLEMLSSVGIEFPLVHLVQGVHSDWFCCSFLFTPYLLPLLDSHLI